MMERVRVYEWFSWSHWGMFREPLFKCPAWFAMGMVDVDDEDVEFLNDASTFSPHKRDTPINLAGE